MEDSYGDQGAVLVETARGARGLRVELTIALRMD